jgi:hypothetical protein
MVGALGIPERSTMITDCAVSTCKKAAFTGKRFCLDHSKDFDMAMGRMKYDRRQKELVGNTPSLHVTDAKEVSEWEAGMSKPGRFRLTQGWTIWEVSGGRFEESRRKH